MADKLATFFAYHRGITINCVCPGAIPTHLRGHSQELLGPNVPDIRSRGVAVNEDQSRD